MIKVTESSELLIKRHAYNFPCVTCFLQFLVPIFFTGDYVHIPTTKQDVVVMSGLYECAGKIRINIIRKPEIKGK